MLAVQQCLLANQEAKFGASFLVGQNIQVSNATVYCDLRYSAFSPGRSSIGRNGVIWNGCCGSRNAACCSWPPLIGSNWTHPCLNVAFGSILNSSAARMLTAGVLPALIQSNSKAR